MIDLLETLFNLLPTWSIAAGLYLIACVGIWRLVCNQNKSAAKAKEYDDAIRAMRDLDSFK